MTIEEFVQWVKDNNVPLSTPMAIRAKDDYLVTADRLSFSDHPYFGNCYDGDDWIRANVPKDADGDTDYDKIPQFLILETGRG